jgi:tight adherence protein C
MLSLSLASASACLWFAHRLTLGESRLEFDKPPRAVGIGVVAASLAVGGALVAGAPGLALAAVPYGVVRLRAQRAKTQYTREVVAALPSLADLLAVAVTAGHGPASALERVVDHVAPVLAPQLNRLAVRVAQGASLRDELAVLGEALGPSAEPLLTVLDASVDDGVGSAAALHAAAGDLRLAQRRAREADIAALPVRMLFPLVVCILPAFVLLTLVPVLADSIDGISTAL